MVYIEEKKDDGSCDLIQASENCHSGLFQAWFMELLHIFRCFQKVSSHLACPLRTRSNHPVDLQWVKLYTSYLSFMFPLIKIDGGRLFSQICRAVELQRCWDFLTRPVCFLFHHVIHFIFLLQYSSSKLHISKSTRGQAESLEGWMSDTPG